MIKECWINVYEYSIGRYYSHYILNEDNAIKYASKEWNDKWGNKRKTVYRLHIKLKE